MGQKEFSNNTSKNILELNLQTIKDQTLQKISSKDLEISAYIRKIERFQVNF